MPPSYQNTYSSSVIGSLRLTKASNSLKHGSGSLFVENSIDLNGSTDQSLRSSNVTADLYIASAKVLNVTSANELNIVSTLGQAKLQSLSGDILLQSSANLVQTCVNRNTTSSASISDIAATNIVNTATNGTFTATSNLAATVSSTTAAAQLFANTVAHMKGATAKVQSTSGNTEVMSFADALVSGVNCSLTSTTKSSLAAPLCEVVGSTTANINAPTVSIGSTANNVVISSSGKQTTVGGNCTITGNLTVSGTTTQISTEQVLIKDNVIVLNDASVVDKDAGFLFKRYLQDTSAFYWDESEKAFVCATVDAAGADGVTNLVRKDLAVLKCKSLAVSTIEQDGFFTADISLIDNAVTAVAIPGLTKSRGCVDLQISSTAEGGACWMYRIVKASTLSASFSSFGVSQCALTDEDLDVTWDASGVIKVFHKTFKTGGTGVAIPYKVKVLSVSSA